MRAAYEFAEPIGRNRALAYGHTQPHAALYVRRFVQHSLEVLRTVPCERLLVLDIVRRGEGWEKLADFLRVPPPRDGTDFPHARPAPTPADAPPTTQRAHGRQQRKKRRARAL